MPAEWAAYVAKHNKIADFSISVLNACDEANVPWGLENPADRSDQSSPAFWDLHADRGSLWQLKEIKNITSRSDVQKFTFAQCHERCGGRAQKWTTISASGHLAAELSELRGLICSHGNVAHAEVLEGFDSKGRSRAGQAAAYSAGLSMIIAEAVVRAARLQQIRGRPVELASP